MYSGSQHYQNAGSTLNGQIRRNTQRKSGREVPGPEAEHGKVRLNAYLAHSGLCSRRDADRMIEAGRVTVNGRVAHPGEQVDAAGRDHVVADGKVIGSSANHIVVAFYKPVGVTCTERDPHADRTLADVFQFPTRLTYAGRLDRDSEGLLLMTNDGVLIDSMMRGSAGHEKEYIVRTVRRISDADLERMRRGMYLRDLCTTTRPCRIERLGERTFSIVLTQGLNRQIRRMVRACGGEVKRLKRTRVLNVELGAMKPGQQRILTKEETESLYQAAGLKAPD